MKFTRKLRTATSATALALALSAPGGATAQTSMPYSLDVLESATVYFLAATVLVQFTSAAETAIMLATGLRVPVSAGGSWPNAALGLEADLNAFTGPGAGWNIARLRATASAELAEGLTGTLLVGPGRISDPGGFSEAGLSIGLRLGYQALASSSPLGWFAQIDRNSTSTGSWETTTYSLGLRVDF